MEMLQCTVILGGPKELRFRLRVTYNRGIVRHIDLDGATTLTHARQIAMTKGYDATNWMVDGAPYVTEFK